VSPWNLNLNGLVNTLSIAGSTVYFGGQFTSAGGATRNKLAAIDTAGNLLPWNPNVENRSVYSLAVGDTTVRFGGDMTAVAGSIRGSFAEASRSGAGALVQ
jgi:hypothetical protein